MTRLEIDEQHAEEEAILRQRAADAERKVADHLATLRGAA